ncbi:hypothetical protein SAMN05421678_108244 [Actinopolymorpha cephalotaxi]|uniref:Uncharacterized protein n=1 Tax=Actinopolymorpha cephalotaxi TaxID=504797 RepID=A0A1I2UTU4_9ACTN|nr:hypothetical protein [Actinopolymorpha cephalotaxi]NYH86658.1 hypothetical protein [Actinopolymorpha cephalotaxi]SFG78366.1 hypothetical protein SAMN05421678_108244 [Actinopolymorpha cephalotaxi]
MKLEIQRLNRQVDDAERQVTAWGRMLVSVRAAEQGKGMPTQVGYLGDPPDLMVAFWERERVRLGDRLRDLLDDGSNT